MTPLQKPIKKMRQISYISQRPEKIPAFEAYEA